MSRNYSDRTPNGRPRGPSDKSRQGQAAPKSAPSTAWPPTSAPAKPAAPAADKPAAGAPAEKPTRIAVATADAPMPTPEQIAERARAIWLKGGCLPGRDNENWLEAERQLRAEMARR